ncbi:hypothetical protein B1NLA3E_02365 [Bacillus sp. 1NLA3E]|nr:hypothetical protein B1NLA3E_02365 [Bacillus sp. 1NLA3E]
MGALIVNDSYLRELRNIRITLIILTIIITLNSGNHTVTVDQNDGSNVLPQFNSSTMVPLENGHFGILTGDTQIGDSEVLKIFYYDQEKNDVIFKKEIPLSQITEQGF